MIWKLLPYLSRRWKWRWLHIITTVAAALTTTEPFIPVASSFGSLPRSISSLSSSFRFIHPHPYHHNRLHRPSPSRFLVKVDPYRDPNQIRPSLHPITINIIAQALKLRASASIQSQPPHNRTNAVTAVWPTQQPLEVVLTVSALAQTALAQRQHSSREDQMFFTLQEQQTIAGRVVGVMVRIQDLELTLLQKCANVTYICQYNEWHAYGLVAPPNTMIQNGHDENDTNDTRQQQLQLSFGNNNNDSIDPLLLLNRAECCLALFLQTVEIPELQRKNATVPDKSRIDFLDADRYQVLVSSS